VGRSVPARLDPAALADRLPVAVIDRQTPARQNHQVTSLRPVTLADAEALDEAMGTSEGPDDFAWFGFPQPGRMRARVNSGDAVTPTRGNLAVATDRGELAGEVSWHKVNHGPNGECWNIGVYLLPACRGQGHGTAAQRLLVEYLFTNTPMQRIEAGTEGGNLAEQRALEKAGFTRDGVLREAVFRDGTYRDMVIYSVLRGEYRNTTEPHP
jgi:RimJ/RimL family protein N-acetyltransferase